MKARGGGTGAFTRTELVVVLAILVLLMAMFLSGITRGRGKALRIQCVKNLRDIGIAYRVWANDNGERFPADTPQTNGGWRELLRRADAGSYAWANYSAMSNELRPSPAILICPTDERKPAVSFAELANTNISYLSAPGADDSFPQAILGGDRNLGPGTTPAWDYGYSPSNGAGNDVIVNGPVCWSLKMHSEGDSSGAGNIMLGDGSSQQVSSGNFYLNWVKPNLETINAERVTNLGPATDSHRFTQTNTNKFNSPGIRLIFP